MKRLRITAAQGIAQAHQARIAIVIVLTPEQFQLASYGETARECRSARTIVERLAAMFESGEFSPFESKPTTPTDRHASAVPLRDPHQPPRDPREDRKREDLRG